MGFCGGYVYSPFISSKLQARIVELQEYTVQLKSHITELEQAIGHQNGVITDIRDSIMSYRSSAAYSKARLQEAKDEIKGRDAHIRALEAFLKDLRAKGII